MSPLRSVVEKEEELLAERGIQVSPVPNCRCSLPEAQPREWASGANACSGSQLFIECSPGLDLVVWELIVQLSSLAG
jgi:hypothetical protein